MIPVESQVESQQTLVRNLLKPADKKHAAFASGEFSGVVNAFTHLCLLADFALRELRAAYQDDLKTALPGGADVCKKIDDSGTGAHSRNSLSRRIVQNSFRCDTRHNRLKQTRCSVLAGNTNPPDDDARAKQV
jgi:hypothetical protein